MRASRSDTVKLREQYPAGLRGQRRAILVQLKRAGRVTVRDLATTLRLSLNAVRHHLRELEADGLVEHDREHHGVGAPAFAYRLAPAGERLFPRRYEAALLDCLDHVAQRDGRQGAVELLENQFATLAGKLGPTAGAAPARRLTLVARALADAGYMAEAESAGDSEGTLTEHNCAMKAVAERFPELCAAEARFLEGALGASVERTSHILSGCGACEYHVRFDRPARALEDSV